MTNSIMGLSKHSPAKNITIGKKKVEVKSEKPKRGDENTQKTTKHIQKEIILANQSHLGRVKLTEVTNEIFSSLRKEEICRYGTTGWILRCPQCDNLIIMEDDTHKTYVTENNSYYRLQPSLVCPNEKCNWHVFAVVVPEDIDLEEENKGKQDDNKTTTSSFTKNHSK